MFTECCLAIPFSCGLPLSTNKTSKEMNLNK